MCCTRSHFTVLGAIAAALMCATLGACGTDNSNGAETAVRSFLDARESGNAAAACALMSPGQQLEMVSLITADVARASATKCKRFVLSHSPASTATKPENAVLRSAELESRILRAGGWQAASVHPRGASGPQMEVIRDHGRWTVDGSAYEKVSFIGECSRETGEADRCACLFEQGLRKRGLNIYAVHPPAASIVRAALSDAAAACAATTPTS